MARDTMTVPREVLVETLAFIESEMHWSQPAPDMGEEPSNQFTYDAIPVAMALREALSSSDPEGGARGERADQGSIADARQCNEQSEQSLSPAFGIIDPDYARIFTIARCLAWAEGYAIAMHGSFTRDLDLIAVPWAQHACEPEHLAKRIESAAGLKISVSPKNDKPFGRLVWTMTLPDFGDPRFVDLSIIPRSSIEQDGQAELSEGEQRMIDLAWEAHKAARPIDASALAEEIRIQMNVRKTCVVSGVEALAKGIIEAFTITPLTKTPSVDHDDGNLRGLSEQTDSHGDGYFGLARERGYIMPSAPNHQPHALSQGWRTDLENAPSPSDLELCDCLLLIQSVSGEVLHATGKIGSAYRASVAPYQFEPHECSAWRVVPAPPSPDNAKTGGAS